MAAVLMAGGAFRNGPSERKEINEGYMEVIPNVHCIPGAIVNCFLIADSDGLTLIDSGLPGNDKKILKQIVEMGHKPGDLRRILITHSDGDHVGALAELKAATRVRVYASEIEARAIAEGKSSREIHASGPAVLLFTITGFFFKAKPATVDDFLTNGQLLPVLGGLRVVATPGHTPGHVSFFAPGAGILFAGDSLTSRNGRLRGSRGAVTWNQEEANASKQLQAELGARIVCPGHGRVVMDAAGKILGA
jgi:glyoxylase-like metal-dependent hydrolase (beta-lactamase superfamily II)